MPRRLRRRGSPGPSRSARDSPPRSARDSPETSPRLFEAPSTRPRLEGRGVLAGTSRGVRRGPWRLGSPRLAPRGRAHFARTSPLVLEPSNDPPQGGFARQKQPPVGPPLHPGVEESFFNESPVFRHLAPRTRPSRSRSSRPPCKQAPGPKRAFHFPVNPRFFILTAPRPRAREGVRNSPGARAQRGGDQRGDQGHERARAKAPSHLVRASCGPLEGWGGEAPRPPRATRGEERGNDASASRARHQGEASRAHPPPRAVNPPPAPTPAPPPANPGQPLVSTPRVPRGPPTLAGDLEATHPARGSRRPDHSRLRRGEPHDGVERHGPLARPLGPGVRPGEAGLSIDGIAIRTHR